MDSHAKGRAREREIMLEYEAAGFKCWQPPRGKYAEQDILGVGDFITISRDGVAMVQVCDKKSAARHRRAVDAYNAVYGEVMRCYLITYP